MSRYIDADSITEELRAWQEAMKKRGNETMAEDYEHCIDLIHQEPTADVRENVRGEWIKPISRGDVLSYGKAYYECDQCHKVAFFGNEMNFCPNCGADMRGDNHD